ncbi:MAG: hypothetical protein ACFBSD_07020 [Paracoccaceae bacterium]
MIRPGVGLVVLLTFAAEPARASDADAAADTAARARAGHFDAVTTIGCAQERGEAPGPCTARVARSGRSATVVVTFPTGFARRLLTRDGAFVKADATMSGSGRDTDWRAERRRHLIRVDDQRYDLPDAFVFRD